MRGVFLDRATLGSGIDVSSLETLDVDWQFYDFSEPSEVAERCANADIVITNKVVLTGKLIAQLKCLKLICVAATGMNNIDLDAAKASNVTVKNVTNYAGNSVAQVVFASVMQLMTHTLGYDKLVKQGKWSESRSFCLFDFPISELTGKTLGLIGYGTLAKTVEKIGRAFDMNVMIAEHKGVNNVRSGREHFDTVVSSADVISLHCPLTTDTSNLFDLFEFGQMKANAILVNTARGGIVNEDALMTAIASNEIGGAVIDVITDEPPSSGYPLLNFDHKNLIVTPHIAWSSQEARQRLTDQLVQNIRQFIQSP